MLSSLMEMIIEKHPELSRAEVEKELDCRLSLDNSPTVGGINTGDNSCWSTIQSDSNTPPNISPTSSPLHITVETDSFISRGSVADSGRANIVATSNSVVNEYDDLDSSVIYV